MSLILLRHTRPAGAEGLCYGRSELMPGTGFEAEAAAIIAALPRVARVVSSPRLRCLQLAERIAAARGLALSQDARLAEMDFGAWEGRRWAAISRLELAAWAADFIGAAPHGGESVAMLRARVQDALDTAEPADPPVLWVTHSGVVRAACALTGRARGWETALDFGTWLSFEAGPGAARARER